MKKIFRIFTTLALLGCANCGVSGTNAAAGEQTADPVAEAEAEPAPVEVRPVDAALIVISKESMSLAVYDFCSRLLVSYPIACGKGIGNKEKPGDMKTPEGAFSVQQIQDARTWSHDFGDGKGEIKGAYGSHFIRLKTPGHSGIGIHGTHNPASIGTRATEGCIRLHNEDLLDLVKYVYVGMPVIITTSEADSAVPCKMPAAAKKGPGLIKRETAPAKKEISAGAQPEATAGRGAVKQHTVQSGETLSTIAERYGMPLSRLRELNPGVRADRINAGQQLVVEPKK